MKVDKDCSHHMFVTAPLPKFMDSSVKNTRVMQRGYRHMGATKSWGEGEEERSWGGGSMVIDGQRVKIH